MAKKGGSESSTTRPDPETMAYLRKVYGAAEGASQQPYTPYGGQSVAGVSDLSTGAAGTFQRGMGLADVGGRAMGGDQQAFSQFFNPYQSNVLDSMTRQTDQAVQRSGMSVADQATQAGAFGGSRHGVAQGEAAAGIYNAGLDRMAQFQNQGFTDSWNRAQQTANFGMGAAQSAAGMGDYFRNVQQQQLSDQENKFNEARDWDIRNLNVLKSGMSGAPTGSTTTTPSNTNAASGIMGGALAGSKFGVPGAIIGGVAGSGILG